MRRFEALLAGHPRERYLHYDFGLALAQQGSPTALDAFRKEVELFPDDVLARVELGFGLLARGSEAEAVAPAEEATRLAPGLFVTHLLLGRALCATGSLERGIRELEASAAMAPKIPADPARARPGVRAGRPPSGRRASQRSLPVARRFASRFAGPARDPPRDALSLRLQFVGRSPPMPIAAVPPLLALLVLPAGGAARAQAAHATQAAPVESFESAARRAQAARDAARDQEAIAAYQTALALRPEWDEGLWYLGTLLYQSGRRAEADVVFERFLKLKPQAGPGWVLRGFCAFEDGDYKAAASRLRSGLVLGLGGNSELDAVARLRLALSFIKTYDFELAIQPLTILARGAPEKPDVVEAVGLALLRMPLLPSEIPPERRDLVQKTGQAGAYHLAERGADAERAYALLVAAYPNEPWVNYAQGVFLRRTDSERAIAALQRELRVNPGNVVACLDIAFELLQLQRNEEAKGVAERAVELAPTLFATHAVLGRALVELGDLERGIRALERAVQLAPEAPEVHFALARAYARAGRDADATRERAEFTRLDQARTAAGGSAPAGTDEVRP